MTRKAWGGRFGADTAPEMERFSSSLAEDRWLVKHDVLGSVAHVRALERARLVHADEAAKLEAGLKAVLGKLDRGEARLEESREDVHMNVEHLLVEEIGAPLAHRLHTARSRNDQVALDLRLWTREASLSLAAALLDLEEALLESAQRHAAAPMPGFTHLQPAQPITFGHWLHAHAVRASRDAGRALAAFDAANAASPLGALALAGTSFPLDPARTAADLEFEGAFSNSLDAVSDRDFAVEAVLAATLAAQHLSGLAEELTLFSSPAYGFLDLPEPWTTGSSIMPQKRNPDAAELLRGRGGRAVGDLVSLLGTLKGLPLAYNRDLQEAKAPLLASLPRATDGARVAAALVRGLVPNANAMKAALLAGHLEATELADYMAARGVPFREAHHVVGELVRLADEKGIHLNELSLTELRERWPVFARDAYEILDPRHVPERKTSPGGTAPARVREAVAASRGALKVARAELEARAAKVARAEATLLGAR